MGLQEIYKKKFIPVSYYLYYYQDLFNLEYEVITKKFEINNDSIKRYLKDIIKKHESKQELIVSVAENRMSFFNENEKENYPELYKAYYQNNSKKSAEHIIVNLLYKYFKRKNSLKELEVSLMKRILEEQEFLLTSNYGLEIPELEESKNKNSEKLKEILNAKISLKYPFFLNEKEEINGKNDDFFKITKNDLLNNTYMLGNIGSGIQESTINLVYSLIKNNINFTYIDNIMDINFYCKINTLFQKLNKHKDFYLFNERNYNLIDEISYFNNKSIYFQNKELDKASDHDVYESMRSTIKYLTSLINHHNGKQPYCVIINDITAFKDEHYEKLESLIKKLNNKNIFVIFQEQGFWQLTEQKENFINNIGNHIIMKTESMLVEKCLNIEILKTKKLQAGEFYCVKLNNTKINNNKVYKIEPIEIEVNDFECSYLNIP